MKEKRHRLLFLGLLLAITLSAVVWVAEQEESTSDTVAAVSKLKGEVGYKKPVKERADEQVGVPLDRLQRVTMTVSEANPFNAKSWYVPPPPPPPAPPPKPTAPPLPFTYVGKLTEPDGTWLVYLAKGHESFIVKKGETFDGASYKLEGIENGNLVIQYLPIPTRHLLPTADNI